MKTAATYLLAFLFIFLLCPDNSAAQDIEGELKSYAALCDSCLMLKKSLSEGAAVSPDKAKSLIGRFVETGKRLKSMSMTPWQKDIYRIITGRFSRSSYTEPFAAEIPRLPAMQSGVIEAGDSVDNRTDIWSLGIIMQGLGRRYRHIAARCLRRNPAQRYPDAEAISADIAGLGKGRGAWLGITAAVLILGFALLRDHRLRQAFVFLLQELSERFLARELKLILGDE